MGVIEPILSMYIISLGPLYHKIFRPPQKIDYLLFLLTEDGLIRNVVSRDTN